MIRKRNLSIILVITNRYRCDGLFLFVKRALANETIRVEYLHAIFGRGAEFRDFFAREFKNYGKKRAKGQEETEGIPDSTQRSHSTIPSRFDAAGGCSRHVVSPTLCPFSTFRTALALPSTHIHLYQPPNSLILVVSASSLFILTSLCWSGHVSLGASNDPLTPDLEPTVAALCLPLL
jgi:hypothetical protein